jgi:hypothetical protein
MPASVFTWRPGARNPEYHRGSASRPRWGIASVDGVYAACAVLGGAALAAYTMMS